MMNAKYKTNMRCMRNLLENVIVNFFFKYNIQYLDYKNFSYTDNYNLKSTKNTLQKMIKTFIFC